MRLRQCFCHIIQQLPILKQLAVAGVQSAHSNSTSYDSGLVLKFEHRAGANARIHEMAILR
jgi:hypothetical protein